MKKLMFFGLLLTSFIGYSADLIVEEFGVSPTYSSIQSAVTAAASGDRILIKNRAGGIPWIENVTIDKNIELLSYDNDTFFVVQGVYTVNAASNRTVIINGMKNTSGSIVAGTGTGVAEVWVIDSWLVNGSVNFYDVDFRLNVVSSQLDEGYIRLLKGNVVGSKITTSSYHSIEVLQTGAYASDTVMIVGNMINNTTGSSSYYAIYAASSQVVFHIKNNFVRHNYYGIYISSTASTSQPNLVYNNTIICTGSASCYSLFINTTPSGSVVEVLNNLIDELTAGTAYGIYTSSISGQLNAYYNYVDVSHTTELFGTYTFQSNNDITTAQDFNTTTGVINSGTAINGGNPALAYSDLDLSRGDAGCYGGSYTLNNFFPLFKGSARVFFVEFPYNVRQGSTLKISGYSFDR